MLAYTPQDFYADSSLGYLVRCINQTNSASLEPLFAEAGLTYSQWSVMVLISQRIAVTCAELARNMAHDNGAMTRLVDALVARDWIERTRDTADRRVVRLALTPAGREVALRCRARVMDRWNNWLHDWDRDDFETLRRLLQKLKASLEAGASDQPAKGVAP
jgi:DNA-binding MarR family transcriptional regulator